MRHPCEPAADLRLTEYSELTGAIPTKAEGPARQYTRPAPVGAWTVAAKVVSGREAGVLLTFKTLRCAWSGKYPKRTKTPLKISEYTHYYTTPNALSTVIASHRSPF